MDELSEEVINPIFRFWAMITLFFSTIIVTPISIIYYMFYEGPVNIRIIIAIFLMTIIPISVIGTSFTFRMIFPKMIVFKLTEFDVVFNTKVRDFSVIYKEIESVTFLNDIFGVNGCTLKLKSGKRRYIGQIGKGLIDELKEKFEKNRIPYDTLSRKEYTNMNNPQR
jgi:hypothetical protein